MPHLNIHLARLRLHWYAAATANALRRNWQAVVLAIVLIPAGLPLPWILGILGSPVTMVISAGNSLGWYFFHILILQFTAVAWIHVQRNNLSGGPFMSYARTLPIKLGVLRVTNLIMLLVADSILLIPIVASLAVVSPHTVTPNDAAYHFCSVLALAALTILVQVAVLEQSPIAFAALPLDLLLAWSLQGHRGIQGMALLAVTFVGALFLLLRPPRQAVLRNRIFRSRKTSRSAFTPSTAWLSPTSLIQIKALLVEHFPSTTLRVGLSIVVAYGADILIRIFGYDMRTLPTAIIGMALSALILSGLYRILHSAHVAMGRYLATFPIPRYFWLARDIGLVTLIGLLPLGTLVIPLLRVDNVHESTVGALAVANLVLMALLRLPLLLGGRQVLLLSVLLAAGWSGAAMAAVL